MAAACRRLCRCTLARCRAPAGRLLVWHGRTLHAAAASDRAQVAADAPASFRVSAKELSGKGKVRLDAYLAAQLKGASRARVTSAIKAGLVTLNGVPCTKPATSLAPGDALTAQLPPPEPSTAVPEPIALDVVYEDDALLVVNKPAGMVVHISPGHARGTLVNALLAHCSLPGMKVASGSTPLAFEAVGPGLSSSGQSWDEGDEGWEDEEEGWQDDSRPPARSAGAGAATGGITSPAGGILRPGIVHRLDKGTTGLMVVAKQAAVHEALCNQFKSRKVSRTYWAITLRVPGDAGASSTSAMPAAGTSGRVATNIARDPGNRLRMAALPYGVTRGRTAASRWRVLEVLAGSGAALVEWRLDTGRTHQIRVHAKHLGAPLFGDSLYGGSAAAAVQALAGTRPSLQSSARALAAQYSERPALHALTLGFTHPHTMEDMHFDSELPPDFSQLLQLLRGFGTSNAS